MRYFIELSYDGTGYGGWQSQPNTNSVQQTLSDVLQVLLRHPVVITGCGRTDAGVHAEGYFAHFDTDRILPKDLRFRLNRLLPPDIAVHRIHSVHQEAHARFDAIQRRYRYRITLQKDPFLTHRAWSYPFPETPDIEVLNQAAQILLNYTEFAPFCKTNSDAQTRICDVRESFWIPSADGRQLIYYITSDRFLRGMIRLVVGMCLRVAAGKTSLDEVRSAMDQQSLLHGSWLVPPDGLTLLDVRYPYL
ncbi:MAG: tRNA pseudouridine(38-40) synthase TruA [Saprospiraceae bacterium]|nr:tRNA pseudouridine(38-40) synthase TruA [Saprospiraceae bacterium]